jgi:hypothetical protein
MIARTPRKIGPTSQAQRWIALCRRHQHRALRNGARAMIGVVVARTEEQHEVELRSWPRAIRANERRAGWPFAVQPFERVVQRMAPKEDVVRAQAEAGFVSLVLDGKSFDRDAVDFVSAFSVLVAPP